MKLINNDPFDQVTEFSMFRIVYTYRISDQSRIREILVTSQHWFVLIDPGWYSSKFELTNIEFPLLP